MNPDTSRLVRDSWARRAHPRLRRLDESSPPPMAMAMAMPMPMPMPMPGVA
jgi:hypothetical protein